MRQTMHDLKAMAMGRTAACLLTGLLALGCGGPADLGTPGVNPDLLPGSPGRALLASSSGKLVEVALASGAVRTLRRAGQGEVDLIWTLPERDWESSLLGLEMPTSHGRDLVASWLDHRSGQLVEGPSMTVSGQVIQAPYWLSGSGRMLLSRTLTDSYGRAIDALIWDVDQAEHWSVARWYPGEGFTAFCPAVPDPQGRFAYQSVYFQPPGQEQEHTWLARYDLRSGSVSYLMSSQPGLCAVEMRSDNSLLAIEYAQGAAALVEIQVDGPSAIRLTESTPGLEGYTAQWGQLVYAAVVRNEQVEIRSVDLDTGRIDLLATTAELDDLKAFTLLP